MPPPIPLKPLPPYMGGWQGFELPGEEKLAVLQLMPLLLRHGGLLGFLLEFAWEGEGQKCEGGGKEGGKQGGIKGGLPTAFHTSAPPPGSQALFEERCLPRVLAAVQSPERKRGGGKEKWGGGGNPALLQHSSPLGGRGAQSLYGLGGGIFLPPHSTVPPSPTVETPPPPPQPHTEGQAVSPANQN